MLAPLLLDIKVLVADEIISMLDASSRIDVLNLLADLTKRGLAILFITHDLSLGYYISQRAVILYRGAVVEHGSTEAIFSTPLHPYTKMLLASVPRLDQKWQPGEAPRQALQHAPPGACAYYDRCPFADRGCARRAPLLVTVEQDHAVACTRALEVEP